MNCKQTIFTDSNHKYHHYIRQISMIQTNKRKLTTGEYGIAFVLDAYIVDINVYNVNVISNILIISQFA